MMNMAPVRDLPIDGLPDSTMQTATITLEIEAAKVIGLAPENLLCWSNNDWAVNLVPVVSLCAATHSPASVIH